MVRTGRESTPLNASVLELENSRVRLQISGDERRLGAVIRQLLQSASTVELAVDRDSLEALSSQGSDALLSRRYARRLQVNRPGGRIRYLKVEDVHWIEAANQYVRLHLGERNYLIRESMSRLTKRLDPARFLRIHRSTIVNLDRVDELHTESSTHYWAVLTNGRRLQVSQAHREQLKSALVG